MNVLSLVYGTSIFTKRIILHFALNYCRTDGSASCSTKTVSSPLGKVTTHGVQSRKIQATYIWKYVSKCSYKAALHIFFPTIFTFISRKVTESLKNSFALYFTIYLSIYLHGKSANKDGALKKGRKA